MTSEDKSKDTKLVIIEVANKLFAKNGFSGTSIRDIAKNANVNIAAINYHFGNKDNLYWQVFDYNYDWIKEGVEKLETKSSNTAELAVETFRFFLNNGDALMNTFKIFLSDNVNTEVPNTSVENEERFGPPGQHIFLEKLKNDLGPEVPEESLYWAVKMIFSLLVHFGVILNTTIMKKRCQAEQDLSPEMIEHSIHHAVLSHIAYLKTNPSLQGLKLKSR